MTNTFPDQKSAVQQLELQNVLNEAKVEGVVTGAEDLPLGRSREN